MAASVSNDCSTREPGAAIWGVSQSVGRVLKCDDVWEQSAFTRDSRLRLGGRRPTFHSGDWFVAILVLTWPDSFDWRAAVGGLAGWPDASARSFHVSRTLRFGCKGAFWSYSASCRFCGQPPSLEDPLMPSVSRVNCTADSCLVRFTFGSRNMAPVAIA